MNKTPIQLPQLTDESRATWRLACGGLAAVSLAFSLVVAGVLLAEMVREHRENPLAAEKIVRLTADLSALQQAADVDLKKSASLMGQIREEDLRVRREFFTRQRFMRLGSFLLLGGMLALGVSVKVFFKVSERLPMPTPTNPPSDEADRGRALARWALAGGGLITALALAAVAMTSAPPPIASTSLPNNNTINPTDPGATIVTPPDSSEDLLMKQNWPALRGPNGCATAAPGNWPREWDGKSGKNILWKTPIPLPGSNSPIVWENKVFLSGSDGLKREVYCYDATIGKLLWQQLVSKTDKPVPTDDIVKTGAWYAPSTMATDGQRVYAIFPSGDVAAYDFDGNRVWGRNLGLPDNGYGHSASLITYKNQLIIQLDQGEEKDNKSALLSLDGKTGKETWRTKRAVGCSWSSPTIVPGPHGPQIITCGIPLIAAYNAADGAPIWYVTGNSGEVAPSPAFAKGIAYICVERGDLRAIRIDGTGDVTNSHVTWTNSEGYLPDVVSPLVANDLIFLAKDMQVTCVDAKDGKTIWEQEIKVRFHASPILVGDTIYLLDQDGVMHMFKADRTFAETKADLGDPPGDSEDKKYVSATPAFVGGKIFIRGRMTLYCIGSK